MSKGGLEQTSDAAWDGVDLVAEEIAVIVPVEDAVLADASFNLWAELEDRRRAVRSADRRGGIQRRQQAGDVARGDHSRRDGRGEYRRRVRARRGAAFTATSRRRSSSSRPTGSTRPAGRGRMTSAADSRGPLGDREHSARAPRRPHGTCRFVRGVRLDTSARRWRSTATGRHSARDPPDLTMQASPKVSSAMTRAR